MIQRQAEIEIEKRARELDKPIEGRRQREKTVEELERKKSLLLALDIFSPMGLIHLYFTIICYHTVL